jgi:hypothetical protein
MPHHCCGRARFHHDRRHLDMFRHIPAEGGLQIQCLAGNAREFLVTHRAERAQRTANARHRLRYTGQIATDASGVNVLNDASSDRRMLRPRHSEQQ